MDVCLAGQLVARGDLAQFHQPLHLVPIDIDELDNYLVEWRGYNFLWIKGSEVKKITAQIKTSIEITTERRSGVSAFTRKVTRTGSIYKDDAGRFHVECRVQTYYERDYAHYLLDHPVSQFETWEVR